MNEYKDMSLEQLKCERHKILQEMASRMPKEVVSMQPSTIDLKFREVSGQLTLKNGDFCVNLTDENFDFVLDCLAEISLGKSTRYESKEITIYPSIGFGYRQAVMLDSQDRVAIVTDIFDVVDKMEGISKGERIWTT